jgi:hypothetical protein
MAGALWKEAPAGFKRRRVDESCIYDDEPRMFFAGDYGAVRLLTDPEALDPGSPRTI